MLNISCLLKPCFIQTAKLQNNSKILNEYYEAKTTYKSLFCNHIKDITIIFFL